MARTPKRPPTERADPLKAVGLQPKPTGSSTNGPSTASDAPGHPENTGSSDERQEKVRERELKPDDKKATEKVTAYFTIGQYDKIEELQRGYRKKAKKRITVNALLRRLVEHATVEDIL